MTAYPGYAHAVSSWTAHLRGGGTTPWRTWVTEPPADSPKDHLADSPTDSPADSPADSPVGSPSPDRAPAPHLGARSLPDAVHLELVRRLNLASPGPRSSLEGLADRVLQTAAPGRGLIDVPLPWTPSPRTFGTPAIDPERLPPEELVRLSIGVLAHLLPSVPPPAPVDLPTRWPLPWRRRFRLHGSPATASAVRHSLLAQGYVESDWRPTHVVIALPLEVMMAEHWRTSVRSGGILKWHTVWRRAQASGRLPDSIDVTAAAARLHGRRREPVHVVVAREAQEAAEVTARILGARPVPVEARTDAATSDLLRRFNRIAALVHGPSRVPELAGTLVELLDEADAQPSRVAPAATPPASLAWAHDVAVTSAEELRAAAYAVHGDPEYLAPGVHRLPGPVDPERTLELAVTACLRAWLLQGGAA